MRLFIAILVSDEIKRQLEKLQEEGHRQEGGTPVGAVSWPRPENMHITLIFLGETYPRQRDPIEKIIQEVAKNIPPFSITVEGLSVFPDLSRPRVLFAKIQNGQPLFELHQHLASKLKALGIRLEKRSYQPHLTLGRIRSGKLSDAMTHWLVEKKEAHVGECSVKSVHLMQSQLKPTGSIYTTLFSSTLEGGQKK